MSAHRRVAHWSLSSVHNDRPVIAFSVGISVSSTPRVDKAMTVQFLARVSASNETARFPLRPCSRSRSCVSSLGGQSSNLFACHAISVSDVITRNRVRADVPATSKTAIRQTRWYYAIWLRTDCRTDRLSVSAFPGVGADCFETVQLAVIG